MMGIILAAGEGKRLRPLTSGQPKCLVPFRKKPILSYILETFSACGIERKILVTGYRHEALSPWLGGGLEAVHNPDFASTNMVASLFCSESLWREDIIISYGDIAYGPEVLRKLMEHPSAISLTADRDWLKLWSKRMENPLEDVETFRADDSGQILELGDKPSKLEDVQAQFMGLIKIKAEAQGEVARFYHSLDRAQLYGGRPFAQMHMTTFLRLLIERVGPVHAVYVNGGWVEIDSMDDLRRLEGDVEIRI
jgi:L-glutamine-phosphate cytidylyltransferase